MYTTGISAHLFRIFIHHKVLVCCEFKLICRLLKRVSRAEKNLQLAVSLIAHAQSIAPFLTNLQVWIIVFGHFSSQLRDMSRYTYTVHTLSQSITESAEKPNANAWHQHTERQRHTETGVEREWEMKCETRRQSEAVTIREKNGKLMRKIKHKWKREKVY